jgi:REP element-mobilizing transposase RayT
MCLLSLRPEDSLSAGVSKIKGQASKWLRRNSTGSDAHERLFSRGYFAVTTGKSTRESVEAYLEAQGRHHGYDARWARPPVFVETYAFDESEENRLQAAHAQSLLRLHCVFATWRRTGLFSRSLAADVTAKWRSLARKAAFALLKVSFVPDHVHLALRVHPGTIPAELVCSLMNDAQSVVEAELSRMIRPPGIERLWQPSAYVGSFGELASPQIATYMRRWMDGRFSCERE